MSVKLVLGPPASGRTGQLVDLARQQGMKLSQRVTVIVPGGLHKEAWRRRLCKGEGALGVDLLSLDQFMDQRCVDLACPLRKLSDPKVAIVLRRAMAGAGLKIYRDIASTGGFLTRIGSVVKDFRSAGISPGQMAGLARIPGSGTSDSAGLIEISRIYESFTSKLLQGGWRDSLGTYEWFLAHRATHSTFPILGRGLVILDGFDAFSLLQRRVLASLEEAGCDLAISMTIPPREFSDNPVFHRSFRSLGELLMALRPQLFSHELLQTSDWKSLLYEDDGASAALHDSNLSISGYPWKSDPEKSLCLFWKSPCLLYIDGNLHKKSGNQAPGDVTIELVEAIDRAGEVREALRRIKTLNIGGSSLSDMALLARDTGPYRRLVTDIAAEMGIPCRMEEGLPLMETPAALALFRFMRLFLRDTTDISLDKKGPEFPGNYSPRLSDLLNTLSSPYFQWKLSPEEYEMKPDWAGYFKAVAHWGNIIGGLDQWKQTLELLGRKGSTLEEQGDFETVTDSSDDLIIGREIPDSLPIGSRAQAMLNFLLRLYLRISPPESFDEEGKVISTQGDYCQWLEKIILPAGGEDSLLGSMTEAISLMDDSLAAGTDIRALKQILSFLGDLKWTEATFGPRAMSYEEFLDSLQASCDGITIDFKAADTNTLIFTNIQRVRGIGYEHVFLMGMAEGEFPRAQKDDPLIPEHVRQKLRESAQGRELNPALESREAEFFLESLSRAGKSLSITRPCYSDAGDPWEASPFWEKLVAEGLKPLREEDPFMVKKPCSRMEALSALTLARGGLCSSLFEAEMEVIGKSADIISCRRSGTGSLFNGHLAGLPAAAIATFNRRAFGPSSLESYAECPFRYFLEYLMGLSLEEEPEEGLSALLEGSILHDILRQSLEPDMKNPTLDRINSVSEAVLEQAPERFGFRPPPWWPQIRRRLMAISRGAALGIPMVLEGGEPVAAEAPFGFSADGPPALGIGEGTDRFYIRGVIDRIDRLPDGSLAIVDYKSGSSSRYSRGHFQRGERLQVPLYAKAAEEVMGLGDVSEGFYWHLREGIPSPGRLSKEDEVNYLEVASRRASDCVSGIRGGRFAPFRQPGGCPNYCPGAQFCWSFKASTR